MEMPTVLKYISLLHGIFLKLKKHTKMYELPGQPPGIRLEKVSLVKQRTF